MKRIMLLFLKPSVYLKSTSAGLHLIKPWNTKKKILVSLNNYSFTKCAAESCDGLING